MKKSITSILMLSILIVLSSCTPPTSEDGSGPEPVTTYSRNNIDDMAVDFEIPYGKGINKVLLSLNTDLPQNPVFFLRLPDENWCLIEPGYTYDTYEKDSASGLIVQLTGQDNYMLTITKKPLAFPGGVYEGQGLEQWSFAVMDLTPGTNAGGEITCTDIIYHQLVELSQTQDFDIANITGTDVSGAWKTQPPPDTSYNKTDTTDITVNFKIPKNRGINQVRLELTTNQVQGGAQFSAYSSLFNSWILIILGNNNETGSTSEDGVEFSITEPVANSGNYLFTVTCKPVDPPRGGFEGLPADTWRIRITGLQADSDIQGVVTSWDNNFVPGLLSEDAATPDYDIAHITEIE
ncbi:MAG: hypothetical protein JW822_00090 [Spirochaetales bacterium]|nr:hypothetical protein [Spirochaetales bacterium]